jgi:ankyrin repeat protein
VKGFRTAVQFVAGAAAVILVQGVIAQQTTKDLPALVQSGATKQALEKIHAGADVNQAQGDGTTPLLWAINRSDYDVAEALLAKKANPNAGNAFGALPLLEATRLNDTRMVKMLLDAGATVDSANPDDETALMVAIKGGNFPIVDMLVDLRANVNVVEKFHHQTPLIYAAGQRRADIVKLLLSKGADVKPRALYTDWPSQVTSEPRTQYRSVGGLNALMYAVRSGCYSCVEQLVAAGADINFPTPEGVTPLMLALDNSHNAVAKFLMDKGAYLDVWDWWGRTPLWIAVDRKPPVGGAAAPGRGFGGGARGGRGNGGPGAGRGGADGNGRAAPPPPPANEPPPVSSMTIINALLDAGVDPDPEMNFHRPNAPSRGRFADNQVSTGTTAVFRAVQLNDQEVLEALLKKGANPNINAMGYTAFGLAAGNGPGGRGGSGQANVALMDLLAHHGADVNARINGTLSYSFHIGYGNQNDGVNSKEGTSALHEAARSGRVDLVKHLLDLGANPNLLDGDGQKPIDVIGKARAGANAARGRGRGGTVSITGGNQAALDEIRTLLQAASGNSVASVR